MAISRASIRQGFCSWSDPGNNLYPKHCRKAIGMLLLLPRPRASSLLHTVFIGRLGCVGFWLVFLSGGGGGTFPASPGVYWVAAAKSWQTNFITTLAFIHVLRSTVPIILYQPNFELLRGQTKYPKGLSFTTRSMACSRSWHVKQPLFLDLFVRLQAQQRRESNFRKYLHHRYRTWWKG